MADAASSSTMRTCEKNNSTRDAREKRQQRRAQAHTSFELKGITSVDENEKIACAHEETLISSINAPIGIFVYIRVASQASTRFLARFLQIQLANHRYFRIN